LTISSSFPLPTTGNRVFCLVWHCFEDVLKSRGLSTSDKLEVYTT
jgi:hypothetical protein